MSLKTYYRRPIWVPDNITRTQQFALKWQWLPKVEQVAPLVVIASSAVVATLILIAHGSSAALRLVFVAALVVFAILAVLSSLALVLKVKQDRTLKALSNNPAFRFPEMQDGTPSFKVLKLFNSLEPVVLSPKQRQAVDTWLKEHWVRDHNLSSLFAPTEAAAEWMYEQLQERITTFQSLPLHFPDKFDAACDELLAKYHDQWVQQLEACRELLRERSLKVQHETEVTEHLLAKLQAIEM